MSKSAALILVVVVFLAACESGGGDTPTPSMNHTLTPSLEQPAPRTTPLRLDAEPFRRALARSLGESYRITSVEISDEGDGSTRPSRLIDVIVNFKPAGHRKWSIVYELWSSPAAAETAFEEEAAKAGEDPSSASSTGWFCSSTEEGRSSCTVLTQDAFMHVAPLSRKGTDYYPSVESVTEVAGDAARLLRKDPDS